MSRKKESKNPVRNGRIRGIASELKMQITTLRNDSIQNGAALKILQKT